MSSGNTTVGFEDGEECYALWEDGCYYKARIEYETDNGFYITFIDYDSKHEVTTERLRKLADAPADYYYQEEEVEDGYGYDTTGAPANTTAITDSNAGWRDGEAGDVEVEGDGDAEDDDNDNDEEDEVEEVHEEVMKPPAPEPGVFSRITSGLPETKRNKVAIEILTTEKSYVDSLTVLQDLYLGPLTTLAYQAEQNKLKESEHVLKQKHIDTLFSNIETIYKFNSTLLSQFDERLTAWVGQPVEQQMIGDLFVKVAPFFKMYSQYCQTYEESSKLLEKLRSTAKGGKKLDNFNKFCQDAQNNPRAKGASLSSFLIMPIQRIPRYKLLLTELLKNTEDTHADHKNVAKAIDEVAVVATHINEAVRLRENFDSIQALEQHFIVNPKLVAVGRVFIKHGPLVKKCRGSDKAYEFFLFNNMLAYAGQVGWKYKMHNKIPIDHVFNAKDLPGNKAHEFRILIESSQKSFEVYCKDHKDKMDWVADLQRCKTEITKTIVSGDEVKAAALEANSSSQRCPLCQRPFTLFTRKHHCKACGKLCCDDCSRSRLILAGLRDKEGNIMKVPKRVCDKCAKANSAGQSLSINWKDAGHVKDWTVQTVKGWLESEEIGFGAHVKAFEDYHVDGALLVDLTDENLEMSLHISDALLRKGLLKAIQKLAARNRRVSDGAKVAAMAAAAGGPVPLNTIDEEPQPVVGLWLIDSDGEFAGRGITVKQLTGEPARIAGIKPGDVVTEVNNKLMPTMREVPAVLGGIRPGDKLFLRVNREGRMIVIPLVVGSKTKKKGWLSRSGTATGGVGGGGGVMVDPPAMMSPSTGTNPYAFGQSSISSNASSLSLLTPTPTAGGGMPHFSAPVLLSSNHSPSHAAAIPLPHLALMSPSGLPPHPVLMHSNSGSGSHSQLPMLSPSYLSPYPSHAPPPLPATPPPVPPRMSTATPVSTMSSVPPSTPATPATPVTPASPFSPVVSSPNVGTSLAANPERPSIASVASLISAYVTPPASPLAKVGTSPSSAANPPRRRTHSGGGGAPFAPPPRTTAPPAPSSGAAGIQRSGSNTNLAQAAVPVQTQAHAQASPSSQTSHAPVTADPSLRVASVSGHVHRLSSGNHTLARFTPVGSPRAANPPTHSSGPTPKPLRKSLLVVNPGPDALSNSGSPKSAGASDMPSLSVASKSLAARFEQMEEQAGRGTVRRATAATTVAPAITASSSSSMLSSLFGNANAKQSPPGSSAHSLGSSASPPSSAANSPHLAVRSPPNVLRRSSTHGSLGEKRDSVERKHRNSVHDSTSAAAGGRRSKILTSPPLPAAPTDEAADKKDEGGFFSRLFSRKGKDKDKRSQSPTRGASQSMALASPSSTTTSLTAPASPPPVPARHARQPTSTAPLPPTAAASMSMGSSPGPPLPGRPPRKNSESDIYAGRTPLVRAMSTLDAREMASVPSVAERMALLKQELARPSSASLAVPIGIGTAPPPLGSPNMGSASINSVISGPVLLSANSTSMPLSVLPLSPKPPTGTAGTPEPRRMLARPLPAIPPPGSAAANDSPAVPRRFCDSCGAKIEKTTAQFCISCGLKF